MFNVYGEILQSVSGLSDTIRELDQATGDSKSNLANFLRKQAGHRGSDEIVLERYRRSLWENVQ